MSQFSIKSDTNERGQGQSMQSQCSLVIYIVTSRELVEENMMHSYLCPLAYEQNKGTRHGFSGV
jgi:hypothetical protein